MKTLNLIIYKPGYGGNFITFLLSLDSSTKPYVPKNTTLENDSDRMIFYSYKNIVQRYGKWMNHHNAFFFENKEVMLESFINDPKYDMYTLSMHPTHFYNYNFKETIDRNQGLKVNYIVINLSSNLEYLIDNFKKQNNSFPTLGWNEDELNNSYIQSYNPYSIQFDNFMFGQSKFLEEYRKMNEFLNLTVHTTNALKLYDDWYMERNIKII